MSINTNSSNILTKYRDEVILTGALLITLVPAYFVADMIARAWRFSPLMQSIDVLLIGFTANSLAAAFFGIYISTLLLLYIDNKKRAQSILLLVATTLGLLVLFINGIFIANLAISDVVLIAGGFVLGLIWVGGEKLRYLQISDTSDTLTGRIIEGKGQAPLEFPKAERVLLYLLGGIIVVSFFEAHTDYPPLFEMSAGTLIIQDISQDFSLTNMEPAILAFDVVGSGIFLGVFRWFMGYDTDRSVFVLGPSGSGKTHLITGLYIEAQEHGMRPRNASDELSQQVTRMIEQGGFIEQRTRNAMDLSFEYTSGRYFPKNVDLDAFDYPGEYLPHVPSGLDVLNDDISRYDYEDIIREQVDQGVAIDNSKGVIASGNRSPEPSTDGGRPPNPNEPDSPQPNRSQPEQTSPNQQGDDRQTGQSNGPHGQSQQTSQNQPQGQQDNDQSEPQQPPQQPPQTVLDVGDDAIRERAQVMVEEVCPRVDQADLLILVIDIERLVNDSRSTLDTEWYSNILSRLPDNKEVVVVATKADLLMTGDHGIGTQAWQSEEQFRDHVDQLLREHMGAGGISIAEKPYPVYYQTHDEDGERKMVLGDTMSSGGQIDPGGGMGNQRPKLYGFKELLDRMGR